jgi:hypothetical protein
MPLPSTLGLSEDINYCVVVSLEFEPPPFVCLPLKLEVIRRLLTYTMLFMLCWNYVAWRASTLERVGLLDD